MSKSNNQPDITRTKETEAYPLNSRFEAVDAWPEIGKIPFDPDSLIANEVRPHTDDDELGSLFEEPFYVAVPSPDGRHMVRVLLDLGDDPTLDFNGPVFSEPPPGGEDGDDEA